MAYDLINSCSLSFYLILRSFRGDIKHSGGVAANLVVVFLKLHGLKVGSGISIVNFTSVVNYRDIAGCLIVMDSIVAGSCKVGQCEKRY